MHHTGIKSWLSDQTSDHHRVVTWYHGNNQHYLANYSEGRFFNKINLKTLKSNYNQVFKNRALQHSSSAQNFFSFPKPPFQAKFRSSVQILRKLLVCIEGVDSLQTNNFHKIWTDDRNLTCKGCFEKKKKNFQYNEPCMKVLDFEW